MMTEGHQTHELTLIVRGSPMRFHDQSKRSTFLKLAEAMRRAAADPSMVKDARAFVRRHMATDPHQAAYARRWLELLERPLVEIADRLLADTPEGDLLRDTAPVFGKGFTSREIIDIMEREHHAR